MTSKSMRCSLRFFDNGLPVTVGYPFARITSSDGALHLSSHRAAGQFSASVDAVTEAQRTPHGVRLQTGLDRRFIVGHLQPRRVVAFLRDAGIAVDEEVTQAKWTDV
jgi:hypothetical protein